MWKSYIAVSALVLATMVQLLFLGAQSALGIDHGEGTPSATPTGSATPDVIGGTGAVYVTIRNTGDEPDQLTGATTPVAKVVEFHDITEADGVMQMRPLPVPLEVPAGSELVFAPSAYHVMLIGLTEDLRNGTSFKLELKFERAGAVDVPVEVMPRAAETGTSPVQVGDLVITGAWARPAPALNAPQLATSTPVP